MISPEPNSGCWLWLASLTPSGYGLFAARGMRVAHRVAFEMFVGPIPRNMELDHLCRVRSCVNPQHLEPVTTRENLLRGLSPSAANARKIQCPRGHFYDHVRRDGSRLLRLCSVCEFWHGRRYRARHGIADPRLVDESPGIVPQQAFSEALEKSEQPREAMT